MLKTDPKIRTRRRFASANNVCRRVGRSSLVVLALARVLLSGAASGSDFTWETPPASSNWSASANWAGPFLQFPNSDADTATVQGPNDIDPVLTEDMIIGELTIAAAGDVYTGDGVSNHYLGVTDAGPHSGSITISGAGSQLVVFDQSGYDVFTESLVTSSGGQLTLVGGAAVHTASMLSNGGVIRGEGLLQLGGNQSATNDGRIIAAGGVLTVNSFSGATLDYDGGTGGGHLEAFFDSTLIIDVPTSDPLFDGIVFLEDNSEIQINHPWELDSGNSQLIFNSLNNPATLSGAHALLDSDVHVNDGGANLNAPTTFGPDAVVTLDPGAALTFNGPSTIVDPTSLIMNAAGTALVINENVNVGSGAGFFNWDGVGNTTTVINGGGALRIHAERVDVFDNVMNGSIEMNAGEVSVEVDSGQWEMVGAMQLQNGSLVEGDEMLLTGDLDVSGFNNEINAPVIFGSASTVQVDDASGLRITGTSAVLNGGTWTGAGNVYLDADSATVTAATVIDMPQGVLDLDGQYITGTSLSIQAPLTMNVELFDGGDNSYGESLTIGENGRLNVQLNGAEDHYGIHSPLTLHGENGGATTSLHFEGADLWLAGPTTITGSSTSQARMSIFGSVNIAAGGSLNLQSNSATPNFIWDTATISGDGDLNVLSGSQLQVHQDATVSVDIDNAGRFEPGTFGTGVVLIDGSYVQEATATLGMEIAAPPGADQDWLQVTGFTALAGELEVATLDGFVPTPGQIYTLVTSGLRLGAFDSLSFDTPSALHVTGQLQYTATTVFLDIIDVTVDGDFNGDLALDCADVDALVAELAAGGVDAQFDLNGDGSVSMQDLDHWLADAGELNVGEAYAYGDANLDGVVDGPDFVIWNANKFSATAAWCAGDFNADGVTDGLDFVLWNDNKFTMADVSFQAVPEPSLSFLAVLGGLALCGRANGLKASR